MQSRSSLNPQGIDIASYQEGLDFNLVKAAGKEVVYIKATEGTAYVNPLLLIFCQQAKAVGLKVGFYHYYRLTGDAVAQAQYFYYTIANLPYDCLLALDVEESGGMDAAALSSNVHICMNEIAYLSGQRVMVYTYTSFARNSLLGTYVNMYPLWIADYNNRGLPGDNPIWDTWVGYQYSGSGNIGGIPVDLDEFTNEVFLTKEVTMDVNQAITILVQNGIITDADYWTKAAEVVKYLDALLINMATKLGG
jgi:lysozyme